MSALSLPLSPSLSLSLPSLSLSLPPSLYLSLAPGADGDCEVPAERSCDTIEWSEGWTWVVIGLNGDRVSGRGGGGGYAQSSVMQCACEPAGAAMVPGLFLWLLCDGEFDGGGQFRWCDARGRRELRLDFLMQSQRARFLSTCPGEIYRLRCDSTPDLVPAAFDAIAPHMHTLFRTPSGPALLPFRARLGPRTRLSWWFALQMSRCLLVWVCSLDVPLFLWCCSLYFPVRCLFLWFALDSPTCRLFLCFWRMFLYPSSRRFLRLFQWPLPLSTPPPSEFQCLHPTLLCPPHHISSLSIAVNFGHVLVFPRWRPCSPSVFVAPLCENTLNNAIVGPLTRNPMAG